MKLEQEYEIQLSSENKPEIYYLLAIRENGHSRIVLLDNNKESIKSFKCVHVALDIDNSGRVEKSKQILSEQEFFFCLCSFCQSVAESDFINYSLENGMSNGLINSIYEEIKINLRFKSDFKIQTDCPNFLPFEKDQKNECNLCQWLGLEAYATGLRFRNFCRLKRICEENQNYKWELKKEEFPID